MSHRIEIKIDGNVEVDCEVADVVLNKGFGDDLVASLNIAKPAAPQQRMAKGAGLSGIVSAISPALQNKSAELKANAQASADAAREKAAADEAAANPVRGRES